MKEIGDLWDRQDDMTRNFDHLRYNSAPWMLAKTIFALSIMTLVFLLYALHELPWRLFGSATGILVLALAPFFSGLILGFSFESPRVALAYSIIIGLLSVGMCMALMMLPKFLGLAEYGPGFMRNVWFYGFIIPFLMMLSFASSGAMVSSSTNVYD